MTAVSALILAGGRATRLSGVDKTALIVDGETIFARQLRVIGPLVTEVIVSSPHVVPGHRSVADAIAGAGPLAGIAAGLAACATPWLLVVAGDMPDLSPGLIRRMLAARDGVEAVGIRIGGLPEPLVCLLRAAAVAPVIAARLARADYKASRLLTDSGLAVAWLEDVDPAVVRNINTPDDLR